MPTVSPLDHWPVGAQGSRHFRWLGCSPRLVGAAPEGLSECRLSLRLLTRPGQCTASTCRPDQQVIASELLPEFEERIGWPRFSFETPDLADESNPLSEIAVGRTPRRSCPDRRMAGEGWLRHAANTPKSCVQDVLQNGSWWRWWACGQRAALSTGRSYEHHAAMRRASFLCSRRSSMFR
jgi:hypothetical protein